MKKISFECNDSSAELFIKILCKLSNVSIRNHNRKIRIGGDEYDFIKGVDGITTISVDDKKLSDMTPQEERDIQILRENAIPTTAVVNNLGTSGPIAAPIPPIPPTDNAKDDDDYDLLNSDEAIAVKDIISNRVAQGSMFTAFDITKELRGKGNQVQHRNIKEIVHALYAHGDMTGYNRSLIDVSGAPVQPFLYHPSASDPSTYQV